jgi:Kazal-type serine protease inhibitor-like protein
MRGRRDRLANFRIRTIAASLVVLAGLAGTAGAAGVGESCGGIANISCNTGLWCEPQVGQCAGADIAGKCVRVPDFCYELMKPVCGCDKKTYTNDCERQRAKAQKSGDGGC